MEFVGILFVILVFVMATDSGFLSKFLKHREKVSRLSRDDRKAMEELRKRVDEMQKLQETFIINADQNYGDRIAKLERKQQSAVEQNKLPEQITLPEQNTQTDQNILGQGR